jgi:Domain of unknown function (DUF4388)
MDRLPDWVRKVGVTSIAPPGKLRLRPGAGLQGQLDECCVLDVVQLLVQTAKTGRLELYPEGRGAQAVPCTVFVHAGNIVHAETGVDGGHSALWKALRITKGEFSFFSGEHTGAITIRENPMMLLLEACRKQDEEAAEIGKKKREQSQTRSSVRGNAILRQREGERSVFVKKAPVRRRGVGK